MKKLYTFSVWECEAVDIVETVDIDVEPGVAEVETEFDETFVIAEPKIYYMLLLNS